MGRFSGSAADRRSVDELLTISELCKRLGLIHDLVASTKIITSVIVHDVQVLQSCVLIGNTACDISCSSGVIKCIRQKVNDKKERKTVETALHA